MSQSQYLGFNAPGVLAQILEHKKAEIQCVPYKIIPLLFVCNEGNDFCNGLCRRLPKLFKSTSTIMNDLFFSGTYLSVSVCVQDSGTMTDASVSVLIDVD